MAKERKARKKVVKEVDVQKPLIPIELEKFGTEDDPCFGKHHDLTEPECKRCGDSGICLIIYNQNKTVKARNEIESKHRFKDLELDKPKANKKEMKKFAKKLKEKGSITLIITKKLVSKFGITKEEAKEISKSL